MSNGVKETIDKDDLLKPPKVGDIMEGRILAKKKGELFLDLGIVGTGIIYGKEFDDAKNYLKNLKIGDKVFSKVVDMENEDGYIELSINQAGKELTWEQLKQKEENGELIQVKILGANKGGLLAEVCGVQGFLPVSQLSPANYPKVEGGDTAKILKELQKFVGKDLQVQIFDLDPKTNKLILSEKLKEVKKNRENLKKYKIGDIVDGEIVGIVDFGVFIKFGEENIEGLIHISELDWAIIEDPSQIVKLGEKTKAKIIDISDDKVFLSLKALKEDPWKGIEEIYKKGNVVSGKVTKFNPFGAFVEVTPKIQGLCHISEFSSQKKMQELLEIGKKYDFQISEIRPEEHRMSLILTKKPASENE